MTRDDEGTVEGRSMTLVVADEDRDAILLALAHLAAARPGWRDMCSRIAVEYFDGASLFDRFVDLEAGDRRARDREPPPGAIAARARGEERAACVREIVDWLRSDAAAKLRPEQLATMLEDARCGCTS